MQRSATMDWQAERQLGIPGIGGTLSGELIVDLFAGGGGASVGIEAALGRSPDIAINHSPIAIDCHTRNHPSTKHYQSDVFEVDPLAATHGQPVGLLWGSPDCTHHSRCMGAQPRSPRVRSLAWVMADWAQKTQPRRIILENVPEFLSWGPLVERKGADGTPMRTPHGDPWLIPDPERAGETFRAFTTALRDLGYQVDWRTLNSAAFGAPTSRERLFLIAARDGAPVWPASTHGPDAGRPYAAIEPCLNWAHTTQSVVERRTPLAPSTIERIAKTFDRHLTNGCVVDRPATIIKNYTGVFGHDLRRPLGTITCTDHHGLAQPVLIERPDDRVERMANLLATHGARNTPVVVTRDGPRYIADITYRMLQVDELAQAQGFPASYALPRAKTDAQLLIGNSVVPHMSRALVAANLLPAITPAQRPRRAAAAPIPHHETTP